MDIELRNSTKASIFLKPEKHERIISLSSGVIIKGYYKNDHEQ